MLVLFRETEADFVAVQVQVIIVINLTSCFRKEALIPFNT